MNNVYAPLGSCIVRCLLGWSLCGGMGDGDGRGDGVIEQDPRFNEALPPPLPSLMIVFHLRTPSSLTP